MASTLVPKTLRQSIRPLEQSIEQEEYKFDSVQVEDYLTACELATVLIERLASAAQEDLARGIEGRKLTFFLKELIDALEQCVTVFSKVREIALQFARKDVRLAQLEIDTEQAKKVLAKFTRVLRWLDRPPPRVAPTSLPSTANPDDYENLDNILPRLQAGEDL